MREVRTALQSESVTPFIMTTTWQSCAAALDNVAQHADRSLQAVVPPAPRQNPAAW